MCGISFEGPCAEDDHMVVRKPNIRPIERACGAMADPMVFRILLLLF